MDYNIPSGVHAIASSQLDLSSDDEVDYQILNPAPIKDDKNIWFFWHSGFKTMHPYTQRNLRSWHRRFSKHGWVVRVVDYQPGSPTSVSQLLDVNDPTIFPRAFTTNTIGGDYARQHTSDLVRFPLLLKYGGVYADVGLIQIGDIDEVWNRTIGNPESPFEVMSYSTGTPDSRGLANYFLAAKRGNAFFDRCHRLLLELWGADGGKTTTEGMHASPLLKGVPLLEMDITIKEEDKVIGSAEATKRLTDYIIQGQVITMVMCIVDKEDNWDGPQYVVDKIYALEMWTGSQLINLKTDWDGNRAYELMSLPLPKAGEAESDDQKLARDIVESCLRDSFGFKLAHGLILKVYDATLGSKWRANPGSDNIPGTYAHWLRYGVTYWAPDKVLPRVEFELTPAIKTGHLLKP